MRKSRASDTKIPVLGAGDKLDFARHEIQAPYCVIEICPHADFEYRFQQTDTGFPNGIPASSTAINPSFN